MKFNSRAVVELVGATSIVASLIFVGLELRQAQSANANDRTIARVELANDIRAEINQNLEVWMKGNSGAELTALESNLYENLIQSRFSQVSAIGITAVALGSDISMNPGIIEFAYFLYENPGARSTWLKGMERSAERNKIITGSLEPPTSTPLIIMNHLKAFDSANLE